MSHQTHCSYKANLSTVIGRSDFMQIGNYMHHRTSVVLSAANLQRACMMAHPQPKNTQAIPNFSGTPSFWLWACSSRFKFIFFIRASSKFVSTCAARTIKKGPSMAHETQCSIAHESGPLSARSSALRAPLRNISPTQQQEVPSQVEQSFLKPRSGMTCQHPESLEVSNDWQLTRNLANRARLCQMLLDYVEQECHKMAWKGYVEEVVHQVCWGMVRAPSN